MSDGTATEKPTNLVDLMAELIPPPEPAPISLMPQTLGWPISLLVLAGVVVIVIRHVLKVRHAEAYRHAALAALDMAGTAPAEVALVLRQTALAAYPRADVAGLYGQDWLDFLASTGGQSGFKDREGQALVRLPYSDEKTLPAPTVELVRAWIREHDRAALT
ncbi:MAG: DUF4381 domain-containing protein [Pseudomonadota bacterium]